MVVGSGAVVAAEPMLVVVTEVVEVFVGSVVAVVCDVAVDGAVVAAGWVSPELLSPHAAATKVMLATATSLNRTVDIALVVMIHTS